MSFYFSSRSEIWHYVLFCVDYWVAGFRYTSSGQREECFCCSACRRKGQKNGCESSFMSHYDFSNGFGLNNCKILWCGLNVKIGTCNALIHRISWYRLLSAWCYVTLSIDHVLMTGYISFFADWYDLWNYGFIQYKSHHGFNTWFWLLIWMGKLDIEYVSVFYSLCFLLFISPSYLLLRSKGYSSDGWLYSVLFDSQASMPKQYLPLLGQPIALYRWVQDLNIFLVNAIGYAKWCVIMRYFLNSQFIWQ